MHKLLDKLRVRLFYFQYVQCVQQTKAAIAYVNSRALMKYYRVFIGGMFTLVASTLLAILTLLICLVTGALIVIIKKTSHGVSSLAIVLVIGGVFAVWVMTYAVIIVVRKYVSIGYDFKRKKMKMLYDCTFPPETKWRIEVTQSCLTEIFRLLFRV